MHRSKPDLRLIAGLLAGIGYPFLVYFAWGRVPPLLLVGIGMGLLLWRLRRLQEISLPWPAVATLALAGLALAALWRADLAAKAYPVAISLAMAAVFGHSLRHPPSLAERIARLTEPALPPAGVAYTRRVTRVWTVFLLANAAVSTATALWGSLQVWTLWNGFLSYLAMGGLFAGEYVLRRRLRSSVR